jgi:hypothetical protein
MRNWLKRNKIFFETVTAVLLSIMAIVISILQLSTAKKQTALMKKQNEIANMQALLTKNQLDQQEKQTKLMQTQTNIADMQTVLTKDQIHQQRKEAAIATAREWAALRDLLRPIYEKYTTHEGAFHEIPGINNFSKEDRIRWLAEMESLISALGANPVLIAGRHNYERYLSMLGDLSIAKSWITGQDDPRLFAQITQRIGYHVSAMYWDLGMQRSSYSPKDKRFRPYTQEESIFEKGFPWENEIRRKDIAQPSVPPDRLRSR